MTWKKGQSGNPGGLSERAFADAIRIAVNEPDEISGKRKLRLIAEKLVEEAVNGESWAIQQVADRLDGKPAQESTVTLAADQAVISKRARSRPYRFGGVPAFRRNGRLPRTE